MTPARSDSAGDGSTREDTISETAHEEGLDDQPVLDGEQVIDGESQLDGQQVIDGESQLDVDVDDESVLDADDILDVDVVLPEIEFEIGDSVVYPHHGAGTVIRKEQKTVLGESREYLMIKILHNEMTVMVPTENAAKAGLRRVIDEDTLRKVLSLLKDPNSDAPMNWSRRYKHNRDKIKTGDIYELAEVVRNLALREHQKGLSSGEKQMYSRAKKVLSSEMMYALEMDEAQVEAHLTRIILDGSDNAGPIAAATE